MLKMNAKKNSKKLFYIAKFIKDANVLKSNSLVSFVKGAYKAKYQ